MFTIIGSKGVIGSALSRELSQHGKALWLPDRKDNKLFQRNLGIVFYCAGLTSDFAARPRDTVNAHVSLLNDLCACQNFDKLIYLSSTRLYDSTPLVGDSNDFCEETMMSFSPLNKRHLYDLSKALGENICLNFCYGKAFVARLSCVVDFRGCCEGFLPSLFNQLLTRSEVCLESSPFFSRDYIHLNDVVKALCLFAGQNSVKVLNIASGVNILNSEIANVFRVHGKSVSFNQGNLAQENSNRPINISRLRSLGLDPSNVLDLLDQALLHH